MKTKLVYVLTCAPEKDYIEQAHMALWSARHHNPDAHIVLVVDDATDALFVDKRAEVLSYISEMIVVPFEDAALSPMYRSRFIKTQVRELVKGDILFVDSDTICCRNLNEIDQFTCEVGAAGDNNMAFQEDAFKEETIGMVAPLCDISKEEYYYSSGVVYSKDTPMAHKLFALWHRYWLEGTQKGINIDQPAFAKANIEMNHIIENIDDMYNCVLYTQNDYLGKAAILHISKFPQTSFLFKPMVLSIIREQGITSWLEDMILKVHATYLPYDYSIKHSSFMQRRNWIRSIAYAAREYGRYVDATYKEWEFKVGIQAVIKKLMRLHLYRTGIMIWLLYKRYQLRKKSNLRANVCAI